MLNADVCFFGSILKLMLGRESEEEILSRFVQESLNPRIVPSAMFNLFILMQRFPICDMPSQIFIFHVFTHFIKLVDFVTIKSLICEEFCSKK